MGGAGSTGGTGPHLHEGRRAGGAADADHAQVREALPRRLQVLQQAQADGGDGLRARPLSLHPTDLHCVTTELQVVQLKGFWCVKRPSRGVSASDTVHKRQTTHSMWFPGAPR